MWKKMLGASATSATIYKLGADANNFGEGFDAGNQGQDAPGNRHQLFNPVETAGFYLGCARYNQRQQAENNELNENVDRRIQFLMNKPEATAYEFKKINDEVLEHKKRGKGQK